LNGASPLKGGLVKTGGRARIGKMTAAEAARTADFIACIAVHLMKAVRKAANPVFAG